MRLQASDRCEQLVLRDGRRLAFTVTGPLDGSPVLYCHGAIGTPVEATVDLQRVAASVGVRYIAPCRPGVGGSDARPGRTVLDFADDVAALADTLALDRFSVVGVSAGGPYALAIAHRLGERVRRVALCSALAPFCPPHRAPGLQRRIRLPLAALTAAPTLARTLGDAVLPVVARHPGAADPLVPVEHALQLAAALPNCRVFVDPDEGHHFFRSSLEQILAALVDHEPTGVPAALRRPAGSPALTAA
jgi:pimeloyl-ACP methyl ester carboxylesterase